MSQSIKTYKRGQEFLHAKYKRTSEKILFVWVCLQLWKNSKPYLFLVISSETHDLCGALCDTKHVDLHALILAQSK